MPTKATADAKKKPKDKTKEKKSDKDKEKKKADASVDKPKKKSEPTPPAEVAPVAPLDPDAVQLFRRYDRARTGVMLRSDFLQLLRDYAHLPRAAHRGAATRRPPLSLTDSRGIPLGYERSDKNSEFEAGQLFERYDRDHAGALTLDKFAVFFGDFRLQLQSFVDDLIYSSGSVDSDRPRTDLPTQDAPQVTAMQEPMTTSVRAEYQASLWELRKICKEELLPQRERIRSEMTRLRDASVERDERESDLWRMSPRPFERGATNRSLWGDNQRLDRYDALESDLERLDEIVRVTRRQLRTGLDATVEDMKTFLKVTPHMLADARALAMKVYGFPFAPRDSHTEGRDARSLSPRKETRSPSPSSLDKTEAAINEPRPANALNGNHATVEQLHQTLRIKDQLIYQLLQERTALRRQKSTIESDLQELTEVSTHEMRKWAQLTDEMQEEIALLRDQLSRVNQRHDDGMGFSYTNAYA